MKAVLRADDGDGSPLVYVPGLDGTGDLLLGTAPRLAARFRLARLRYENDGPDTYEFLARTVVACLDELQIARAVLLGESFGGAVAMRVALDAPDRVAGLAIVNSFPHFTWRFRLALSRLGALVVQHWLFGVGQTFGARFAFFGRMAEPDALRAFVEVGGAKFDPSYHARLRMIAGLDLRPRLGEITQPVALFASRRDRIVDSVPQARRMVERMPDAQMREIPDGGHVILPLAALGWVDWMQELVQRAADRER